MSTNQAKQAYAKRNGNVVTVQTPISLKSVNALLALGFVVVIRK